MSTYNQEAVEAEFLEWIYQNYPIGNGHQLLEQQENGSNWDKFLSDMGYPADLGF